MKVAVSATAISAVSSVSTDTFGTGWRAVIDGCHDLLAVVFGTNSMDDTFERACREADRASRPQDPRILRARRLLADNASLDRAWAEISGNRRQPEAPIEALVYSLRRRAAESSHPAKGRQLSELDKAHLKAIYRYVQNFSPEIVPPWPPEDVAALIAKWRELHG